MSFFLNVLENISKMDTVSLTICKIQSFPSELTCKIKTHNKKTKTKKPASRSQTRWLRNVKVNCFSSIISIPTVRHLKHQSITSGSCPLLPIPSRLSLILSISLERRRAGGMLGAGKTWTWPLSSGLHGVSLPNLPDDRWMNTHSLTHTTHSLYTQYHNFGDFHKCTGFFFFFVVFFSLWLLQADSTSLLGKYYSGFKVEGEVKLLASRNLKHVGYLEM